MKLGLQAPFMWVRSPGGPERLAVTLPPEAGCPRRPGGVGGGHWGGRCPREGGLLQEVPPALGPAAASCPPGANGFILGVFLHACGDPVEPPLAGAQWAPVMDGRGVHTGHAGRAGAFTRQLGCPGQHGNVGDLNLALRGRAEVGGQRGKRKAKNVLPGRQR